MEIREWNSITAYAVYKMKKCFFDSIFSILGLLFIYFVILESFYHLEWVKNGELTFDIPNFLNNFFFTVIVIFITLGFFVFALLIYLIIVMIKEYKKIRYYKKPRFSIIEIKKIEYDYKLWQTASKNTFHSQEIKMRIDSEERLFKTPIIFTNSKRIGVFKIPPILQSHSYVRGRCEIGYDPKKNEAVILSIL
jgi:hypothetical protein